MAHRKFQHDKIQTVMETWHGLEERFEPGKLTIENCWLSQWDIQPVELVFPNGNPSPFRTLVCTDNEDILVGNPFRPSFVPVLNSDFSKMVADAIAGTGHEMVSCGSIRNRGRVFFSFKLKGMEKFKAAGRDFSAFLNFGNGHDKSSVLWTNTSNGCAVCDNTFTRELERVENKDASGSQLESDDDLRISVRHTKNVQIRLPDLSRTIDKAIGVQAEFQLELDRLSKIACNATQAEALFTGFLVPAKSEEISTRAENRTTRLIQLFTGGAGNDGNGMDDAFSAVTDYFSHESVGDNREKQFLSSEFGASSVAKNRFFEMITDDEKREATIERGNQLLNA